MGYAPQTPSLAVSERLGGRVRNVSTKFDVDILRAVGRHSHDGGRDEEEIIVCPRISGLQEPYHASKAGRWTRAVEHDITA
ncbi:unnamed protein product [Clonostachys rosea]|uniref:Uncharacterized protein n=1 Tax=Bionectria ochroleuca TaxID=29856 RepID=A0ABY6U5G1_BIOOC|nr:unnamed protein product [Clonostachys rosea]